MQQLGSHWTDFHEIWHFGLFWAKSVFKIRVSWKSAKNNRHFTRIPIYIFILSRSVCSYNEKCIRQHLCKKSRHTFMFSDLHFFRNSWRLCDITEKIWHSRKDHRWQRGAYALHDRYLRLQIHTHNMLPSHCKNGCRKAPQAYDIHTLGALFTPSTAHKNLPSFTRFIPCTDLCEPLPYMDTA